MPQLEIAAPGTMSLLVRLDRGAIWRCNCLADIPGVPVAIKYAAQNHNRNDSRVLCITVPVCFVNLKPAI